MNRESLGISMTSFYRKNNMSPQVGQMLMEYVTILGIITIVLLALTPVLKRSIQAIIKTTSDQIGIQNNADQPFNLLINGDIDSRSQYLVNAISATTSATNRQTLETLGTTNYVINDRNTTASTQITNLGFTPRNE